MTGPTRTTAVPADTAESVLRDTRAEFASDGRTRPAMNPRTLGVWLVVLGLIGLWAAADLSIERYLVLTDPTYVPSCSVSIFIDCGPAMGSWQGRLLGFPNPFLGLGAFPVVMATGVIMATGWRPPRWYWRALLSVTTVAMGMIVFLVFTSVHELARLCPYCMIVWAVMVPLWVLQISYAVDSGALPGGRRMRTVLVTNRAFVILAVYVALIVWVVVGLWDAIVQQIQG